MRKNPVAPLLARLAALQVARPWLVMLITALTLLPTGYWLSRLELRSSFSELLPEDKPSVIELERVNQRLPGVTTLTVAAEGKDVESLKRFVDRVSPRIRALGPEYVAGVDDGTRGLEEFFATNKHLYADLGDIRKLRDDVVSRYDYEVGRETGTNLELDDEEVPPKLDAATVKQRFRKKIEDAKRSARGVDGYYIGEGGKLAAILVRTPLGSGDERAFQLEHEILRIVDEERASIADPTLSVAFTGNLVTSAEQHRAVKEDLLHVGLWGVTGILAVTFAFFIRIRTLLALALTIGIGGVWTFGFARLLVGHLNTASGFLVSILAGQGVNVGIMFMARYVEARRDEHAPAAEAIHIAHRDTGTATLAVAGSSMIAYGSLSATDFHGFKHFGIIAGSGMMLCWLATHLFLPTFLVLSERLQPMFTANTPKWRAKLRGFYGVPFAFLVRAMPRPIALAGVATGIASVLIAIAYFRADPMEYDLGNVRNERLAPTSAGTLSVRVDKIVGRAGQDGRAILTERVDQVGPLVLELERRRQAAPADAKPFESVVSIFDLLPKAQTEKLALLGEIQDRLLRAHKRRLVSDDDMREIRKHLPVRLAAIGVQDLPDQLTRPFTERDGTRGTIVYIVPTEGKSVYDARYLMLWADSFREVRLPNGEVVRGTGDPVIYSDMLLNVSEDAPTAIVLSLLGTLVVIAIAFGGRRNGWTTFAVVLLGVFWLIAFLALRNIKLNFLSFMALPITIGVGADYAINMMKRHEITSDSQLGPMLRETAGAVVLCSLTALVGYLALLLSINRAVQSFGLAAAAGEVATLLAAILVLPAFWFWRVRRARTKLAVDAA